MIAAIAGYCDDKRCNNSNDSALKADASAAAITDCGALLAMIAKARAQPDGKDNTVPLDNCSK
jgi:hypothetical protein